jgi:hypothetical protein
LFLVLAGGVMVMTVSQISEYSGAVVFTGTGELNVLGGKEGRRRDAWLCRLIGD